MAEETAQRFEALQRSLQSADRQLGMMEQQIRELRRAKQGLEGIDGDEVLLPIGGGILVPARVDPAAKVLSPIGGEYRVEATREAALEALGRRIEAAEQAFQQVNAQAQQLAQEYQEVGARLQAERQS